MASKAYIRRNGAARMPRKTDLRQAVRGTRQSDTKNSRQCQRQQCIDKPRIKPETSLPCNSDGFTRAVLAEREASRLKGNPPCQRPTLRGCGPRAGPIEPRRRKLTATAMIGRPARTAGGHAENRDETRVIMVHSRSIRSHARYETPARNAGIAKRAVEADGPASRNALQVNAHVVVTSETLWRDGASR